MKNPFKKSDHTLIIAGIAIASVAAGALAYLFLSESGEETRESLKKKIKEIAKDAASGLINKKDKLTKKAGEVIAAQHNQ
jgi:gas vesicle protein